MKFLQLSLEGIDSTWAPVHLAGVCSIVPMSGTQITELLVFKFLHLSLQKIACTQTPVHFKTTALYTGGTSSVYIEESLCKPIINALSQALHIHNSG